MYEIENEYDFSNLVLMLSIIIFPKNLVRKVSFLTGLQKEGLRTLTTYMERNSKVVLVLDPKVPIVATTTGIRQYSY